MKSIAFLGLIGALSLQGFANPLPRSTPEAEGVSSKAIEEFVQAADQTVNNMHGFMLLRHGRVIAEGWWNPYDAQTRHALYSLSKSFTSTAVGLAIAEKKLSLDDEVLKFFPEDAPSQPSQNLKSMRVRDLLRMATGHQTEPERKDVWTKAFLQHPVEHKPGTHFLYNTSGTYMLSAIVQKATGMTVLDYLKPRLFEPIGIEDPVWGTSPQGISLGGYGLSIRTEDIARFGQLCLQKGKWHGKQLVPSAWIEEATSRQIANGSNPASDWDQGYGYQFWRCRHGIYRGDGAFGQYCIVMPDQEAVLAITSGTRDMQNVLNLVWDKLLPGIRQGKLPADREATARLSKQLAALQIPPQSGDRSLNEKLLNRSYSFATNELGLQRLVLKKDQAGASLSLRRGDDNLEIPLSEGKWTKTTASFGSLALQPAAVSAGWTGPEELRVKLCFVETPFLVSARFAFSGDQVTCEAGQNVSLRAAPKQTAIGRAE